MLKFRWFSALGSVCRFAPEFASEIRYDKNRADEAVRPIARALKLDHLSSPIGFDLV